MNLDVVLALGASDPNGKTTFEREKALTSLLVDLQRNIVPGYGIISYSSTAQTPVPLQKFNDVYRLKSQIGMLTWPGSGSDINSAIRQAYSMFRKSKPGSNKVFVLFMNGKASTPLSTLRQAVGLLLNQGVRVIVVGYGDRLDAGQLRVLSGNQDNIIEASDKFREQDIIYKISWTISKGNFF